MPACTAIRLSTTPRSAIGSHNNNMKCNRNGKNRTQSIPCMPLPGLILYFTKIDKNFRPYKHAVQVNKKQDIKKA